MNSQVIAKSSGSRRGGTKAATQAHRDRLRLPEVIEGYKARRRGFTRDAVITAFYRCERMKRVIKHVVLKFYAQQFTEEIRTYTLLLFIEKYLKIQDAEKIYNVMHIAASNRARQLVGKLDNVVEVSADEHKASTYAEESPAYMVDTTTRNPIEQSFDELARAKAFAEFARRTEPNPTPTPAPPAPNGLNTPLRFAGFEIVKQTLTASGAERSTVPRRRRTTRVQTPSIQHSHVTSKRQIPDVNPDTQLLNAIRFEFGYTLIGLASALGVSKGTLSAYLYGTVKSVPSAVMDRAREIASQAKNQKTLEKEDRLRGKPMADVAEDWLQRFESLGLSRLTASHSLQAAVGINRSTLWRWSQQKTEPNWRKVNEHDAAVESYIRRLKLEMRKIVH